MISQVYPVPPPLHFLDTLATPTLAITCVVVVVMAFIIREMTR